VAAILTQDRARRELKKEVQALTGMILWWTAASVTDYETGREPLTIPANRPGSEPGDQL
jgi:hypothetical protein